MSGIKWIASYPDNINVNLPRASASIILNDYNTGRVKAFIEGTAISASRTAASATLATQLLVKDLTTSHHVLFVGCGVISKNIMDFFSVSGISLNMIHLYDINPATAQQFNKYISTQYNLPVSIVKSPQEGFQQANIIVFATTEIIPYISSDDFKLTNLKNKIILGISLRDICPDLIIEANNIVDDVQHCLKANTSIHLTEQLHHHHQFINGTICGLINNTITLSPDKPIIFSPFGMGILDLNVAIYIYKQIQKNKLGVYCAFHE